MLFTDVAIAMSCKIKYYIQVQVWSWLPLLNSRACGSKNGEVRSTNYTNAIAELIPKESLYKMEVPTVEIYCTIHKCAQPAQTQEALWASLVVFLHMNKITFCF